MFCKHCGAEIAENAAFCPACGGSQQETAISVANTNRVATTADPEQERALLLDKMNNSFEVMTALKQTEDEIAKLESELPELEKHSDKTRRDHFIILGVALIIFYLLGIVVIVHTISKYNSSKKKLAEVNQNLSEKRAELETLKNDEVISWLPYDYRDSTSFVMMYNYLNNMRASSLKEALNLLEVERHQARVEMLSEISARASVDAANSASAAATASAASAFFSLFK